MTYVDSAYRLSNVWRLYNQDLENEVTALRDISIDIGIGECMGIVGSSGSGKSTLLSILALLDTPTRGELSLFGADPITSNRRMIEQLRQQHLSILFQDAGLLEELSLRQNVMLPLDYRDTPRVEARNSCIQILQQVGLDTRGGNFPSQVSGGERQRAGLARALVTRPSVLICDEPTAGLDEENSRKIAALLAKFHIEGGTLIFATHDPIVMQICQRLIRLDRGKIVGVS